LKEINVHTNKYSSTLHFELVQPEHRGKFKVNYKLYTESGDLLSSLKFKYKLYQIG